MSCRDLYRDIYEADSPEQAVRELPAQTVYMLVKHQGIEGAADLISMASVEQCRLIADLDLWHNDTVNEENLWKWLALTDETDSLELLQKALKFIDLKVLSILFGKYVEVVIFDEPADQPPHPGFHTADQGNSWVGIKVEDPNKHFLLARLLALIFETSAELYYQLLSISSVATVSMLEDEAYVERTKRLAAEGVPEAEVAAGIHAPYSLNEALSSLYRSQPHYTVEDVRSVDPLLYEARVNRHLAELLAAIPDREAAELELTFILNGAVVFFGIDHSEQELVFALAEKVKGAINIGIEKVRKNAPEDLKTIFNTLGLGVLYRLGWAELSLLRSKARKITDTKLGDLKDDAVSFSVVARAREAFPEMPLFLSESGEVTHYEGELQSGFRAIESMLALESVRMILEQLSS